MKNPLSDFINKSKITEVIVWWRVRPAKIKDNGFTEIVGSHGSSKNYDGKDHDAAILALTTADERWKKALTRPIVEAPKWWHKLVGAKHLNAKLAEENMALREKIAGLHDHMVELGREALSRHMADNVLAGVNAASASYRLYTFEEEEATLRKQLALMGRRLKFMTDAHDRLYTAWQEAHLSSPTFVANPPEKETPSE